MFNGLLGSNKSPNQNRYNRLIALSVVQIFTTFPLSIFSFYVSAHVLTVHPWISWEDTHSDYSFVGQVPSFEWRADPISVVNLELIRWPVVAAAFLFFAFFGFAEEARRNYRKAYSFATSSLRLPDMRKSGSGSSGSGSNSPSPYTPSSSFGHGFKKGMTTFSSFKNPFSGLGSRSSSNSSKSETTISTAERKDSFLVSEYRLTSGSSIFEGVDNPSSSKVLEISPGDDDDSQLAHAPAPAPAIASRSAIQALAAVSNFPAPPPPIARVSVRSLPPGLYPAFPHSPTASDLYLDPSEAV